MFLAISFNQFTKWRTSFCNLFQLTWQKLPFSFNWVFLPTDITLKLNNFLEKWTTLKMWATLRKTTSLQPPNWVRATLKQQVTASGGHLTIIEEGTCKFQTYCWFMLWGCGIIDGNNNTVIVKYYVLKLLSVRKDWPVYNPSTHRERIYINLVLHFMKWKTNIFSSFNSCLGFTKTWKKHLVPALPNNLMTSSLLGIRVFFLFN